MQVVKLIGRTSNIRGQVAFAGVLLSSAIVLGLWLPSAMAQTPPGGQVTDITNMVSAPPRWDQLSATQQQSLIPLASGWDSFSDDHRRKWIALAQNFHSIAPAEREKLHSRMAKWAALKPRERELARLNFAVTKKLAAPDRAADWGIYKALTVEERKRLAARAPSKSAGAATRIKPASPSKLAPVTVTRHTPPQIRLDESSKGSIDRNTLLPISPKPELAPPVTSN